MTIETKDVMTVIESACTVNADGTLTVRFPLTFPIPVRRLDKSGKPHTHTVSIPNVWTLVDNACHGVDQRVNDGLSSFILKDPPFNGNADSWRAACIDKSGRTAASISAGTYGLAKESAAVELARVRKEMADAAAKHESEMAAMRAELAATKESANARRRA